jgi:hypothetical protein
MRRRKWRSNGSRGPAPKVLPSYRSLLPPPSQLSQLAVADWANCNDIVRGYVIFPIHIALQEHLWAWSCCRMLTGLGIQTVPMAIFESVCRLVSQRRFNLQCLVGFWRFDGVVHGPLRYVPRILTKWLALMRNTHKCVLARTGAIIRVEWCQNNC